MSDSPGSAEATQNQVVVYAVLCVPDGHIMEQTTVCAQDLFGLWAQLPVSAEHAPRPAIPQTWLVPWEEFSAHVLEPRYGHVCQNILIPLSALWRWQLGVEISSHHQHGPPGPLGDGHNDVIYCRGIVWVQIASHDILPLSAQHKLKSDDVCAIEAEILHIEVIHLAIEHSAAAAVRTWNLQRHDLVTTKLPRVDPLSNLCIIKYPHFHILLWHSLQGRLQSPVPTFLDIVRLKM